MTYFILRFAFTNDYGAHLLEYWTVRLSLLNKLSSLKEEQIDIFQGPYQLPEGATAYVAIQDHENFLELLTFDDNLTVLDEYPAECL